VKSSLLALALLLAAGSASAEEPLHEVKPGETLAVIASLQLGDSTLWPAIYLANRDQIKDPARVYPGQVLTIPEVPVDEREAVRREGDTLRLRSPDAGGVPVPEDGG
jgi:LysM repeat protein